jgi:hypothetical protein
MSESSVEAARYALLRRLAPAIRHRVVGKLHPIGLIAEAVKWQMQEAAPDLKNAQESIERINSLSRSAMLSFISQITWLAREEGATTTITDGIDDCLGLLHTDFELRGFSVTSEVKACDASISLNALRNVLTAALIAITDSAPTPARLVLSAEASKAHVLLSILIHPAEGKTSALEHSEAYRRLEWTDVQALAGAEAVKLSRSGERVEMRYSIKEGNIAVPGSAAR